MRNFDVMDLLGPVAVGSVSGVGEVLQLNRQQKKVAEALPDNMFMDHIGLITDGVVALVAVGNALLPSPVLQEGSEETMGAGIAIAFRRGTDLLGRNLLGLQSTTTKNPPARHRQVGRGAARIAMNAYEPYESIDTSRSLNAGRRQFITVV